MDNGRGQDVYEKYIFIYFTSFTYLFHPNSFSRVAQGFVIKYYQYEQEIYWDVQLNPIQIKIHIYYNING